MSILGLGTINKTKQTNGKKTDSSKTAATSQSDEAKALLEKMEQKKASGDCPFC